MGALKEYFAAIKRSCLTIGDGLAVTLSYIVREPVTVQYPDRTAKPLIAMLPERSRGMLEIDLDLCTACALCGKTCPIDCIHVETQKAETGRLLSRLDVEMGKCMFCGLCVEVCPTGAIRHSHEFEGGVGNVDLLNIQFVREPRPPAKPPKKGEPINFKPLGSIIRGMYPNAWDKPVKPIPAAAKPVAAPAAPASAPAVVSKEAMAESSTPQSNQTPQGTPPANGGEKS
jgi:formate hydrogenlyase subunit 6/NADH:ubiquinone oxidoreductase subunit I